MTPETSANSPTSPVPLPSLWESMRPMASRVITADKTGPYPNRVTALRNAAGLTQAELGRLTGLSEKTVSKLERGFIQLHAGHLKRLPPALHCHAMELFVDGPRLSAQQLEMLRIMGALSSDAQTRLVTIAQAFSPAAAAKASA